MTNHPAIGIDIGGTKIAVALVGRDGAVLRRAQMATDSRAGFVNGLERIVKAIESVRDESEICGIGIGCAGPVDPVRGVICNPFTLPGWNGAEIVRELRERFAAEVFLENDADAALAGEWMFGAGRNYDRLAMLTFGTGVGGALLSRGKIERGSDGQHPEIGHMIVADKGEGCYCGAEGCLESLASGTAMAKSGQKVGFADAPAVFAAARAGNKGAQAILHTAAETMAKAVWNLGHVYLPQRILLGGGIMEEHYAFFETVIKDRLRHATQIAGEPAQVARAALGNDAGIVGAASLVFAASNELEPLATKP